MLFFQPAGVLHQGQCSFSDYLDAIKYQTGLDVYYMCFMLVFLLHWFCGKLIFWELIWWQVDLMTVDLVEIDLIRIDLIWWELISRQVDLMTVDLVEIDLMRFWVLIKSSGSIWQDVFQVNNKRQSVAHKTQQHVQHNIYLCKWKQISFELCKLNIPGNGISIWI